jgi:hypothetical protein
LQTPRSQDRAFHHARKLAVSRDAPAAFLPRKRFSPRDPEPAWALIAQDRDAFYDAEIEQLFGAVGGPKWDKVPRRPEYRGRGRGGAQHRRTD